MNAAESLHLDGVGSVLVGAASLQAEQLLSIIQAVPPPRGSPAFAAPCEEVLDLD